MRKKLLLVAAVALFLTGCLGGGGSQGTADVGVYLTHTASEQAVASLTAAEVAAEEIEEVWVTITSVEARRNNRWEKILDVPEEKQHINLMDLGFREALLGHGELPAGRYTEMRFQVKENSETLYNYVVVNGEERPLKVPSNKLKPKINIAIAADTIVELVFDVDQNYFAEPGDRFNANPRKTLRFVGMLEQEFGSLIGEIKLPEWISGEVLQIDVHLFRVGRDQPVWTTSLEDGVLRFELETVLAGEYRVEATITYREIASITLEASFEIKANEAGQIIIRNQP